MLDLLPELRLDTLSLEDKGALLLKSQTYLIYVGKIRLPKGLRGHLSPKSSIGRVDLMVRGIVDGCGLYDTIPEGTESDLWLEITPQSFNVRLKRGIALTQLMVLRSSADEDSESTEGGAASSVIHTHASKLLFDASKKPLTPHVHRGAVVLSLNVPSNVNELAGFEARTTSEVVDLSSVGTHDPKSFFRPIMGNGKRKLTLEKDRFYILCTKERVSVPLDVSGEMVPFSNLVGELRAHYAGFFDPGFGYGKKGEKKGTIAVLEVRPHETITIYDGQPICLMEFFRNTGIPEKPYGWSGNNYAEQTGPKLAKFFAPISKAIETTREAKN